MESVTLPSGGRHTFAYDPKGKRIETKRPSDITKFTWDLENVLAEFNNGGSTNRVYTHEPAQYGNLLSHKTSSDNLYYHFDALGSTRLTSNASAVASLPFIYAAFGDTITAPTNPGTPYQWVGQLGYQFDPEIMLNYIRARFYDPNNGTWLSEDPLGMIKSWLEQHEPNLYRYVMSNPVMMVDPSGEATVINCLSAIGQFVAAAVAVGALGFVVCAGPCAISVPGALPTLGQSLWLCILCVAAVTTLEMATLIEFGCQILTDCFDCKYDCDNIPLFN